MVYYHDEVLKCLINLSVGVGSCAHANLLKDISKFLPLFFAV